MGNRSCFWDNRNINLVGIKNINVVEEEHIVEMTLKCVSKKVKAVESQKR